ncbi:bis(5'-nucleosyl)-tetraphosphatase (symmetrical) YqeK [Neobacillus cucumis]|uniref:bis(5'-nucleosyl)-tetraphosphatase (symmetrical) YqeK n=1 Tax=Neobacillus cucumis TaxID=1740721 RepID=UPI00203ACBBA|nr:bis(5'-nucleosyl)-tetraphosphatase (symmetrical) YqeK [Neobacillus cucumis]MCM3725202.1 bis(5'-nucleosyl)-tetraphosphatase (symmetrical) YqeK [Neobacillus cucumis]
MERQKALDLVKLQLTEHRYQHTLGVMQTAIILAEKYGADVKKAELAAIFHDYAKFRPKDEMKEIIMSQGMPQDLLLYNTELWHAPVGAYLVEKEAGVSDYEVLDAIRYHTSGRPNMTLLEKVIYLADYIEPGRHFPGVEEVREIANENLEKAIIKAIQNTIHFLMKKNQTIYPETFYTYNDLIQKLED